MSKSKINRKNVVFTDMPYIHNWEFLIYLEKATNKPWKEVSYVSNDIKRHFSELIRYGKYFYYSFIILINRRKYANIVTWQQFHGLLFASYCRLFLVKKTFSLIVMTFIYKQKSGWKGRIYHSLIHFALTSKYIDKIIVFSQQEVNYYAGLFPDVQAKFVYIPLGIERITNTVKNEEWKKEKYLLSVGRSNRDYDFLYEAIKDTAFHLKIISNSFHDKPLDNIKLFNSVFAPEMFDYMENCFCVVLPLSNPKISSGQLVILQAMQLGKPIIVTESEGISDYITHGYNGLIIKKEKKALIETLTLLYSDKTLYRRLSENGRVEFEKKHTFKQLGENIANCL
jgi:glycosyltransferase involved in cell wall biosynthesis